MPTASILGGIKVSMASSEAMLPLLPDMPAGATIAYRDTRPVDQQMFLEDVLAWAHRLPQADYVLNMCVDRYWFAVAFFAAIARGMVSILPNSAAPEHIASVCNSVQNLVCVGDLVTPALSHRPYLQIRHLAHAPTDSASSMPQIPLTQCVACVYTSGSTGQPQAHYKSFGSLRQSVGAAGARLWEATGGPCAVLGTVPFRHMYGLESSVLLPLFCAGQLSARTPFFPADVVSALMELPAPRLLVTTPFHLRKLLDADVTIPPLAAVLSATAPLSLALATRAEALLDAPVLEIYGATETGQLATRRATTGIEWETLGGVRLAQQLDSTVACGGHLSSEQKLNDMVELIKPTRFRLIDRNANMINIAGKRSSLTFLNHTLTQVPGVRDAIFCVPKHKDENDVTRLAAFVVAPEMTPGDILTVLRLHLDSVFLPRPIVMVDSLPRDGNGKIPAAALEFLMATHFPLTN